MELRDELAADRQSQATSLDRRVLIAGQAEEGLEDQVEGFGGDARVPSRRRSPTRNRPPTFPMTRTCPPTGVYFRALETRLPKICWQREASVTTDGLGGSARDSQWSWRASGDRGELAVDLVDQGPDRE